MSILKEIKPQDRARHKKKLITMAVVVVLLVGGGLVLWQAQENVRYNSPETQQERDQKHERTMGRARKLSSLWRYDQEVRVLEEYLAAEPEAQYRIPATLELAEAYVKSEQYGLAISRYQTLEDNPDYQLEAWRGLGHAYLGKVDKAEAREYFQQVVDVMKTRTDPESIFRLTSDEAQLNALENK